MASQSEWFRRTTWTDQDQREFSERNRRSRGAFNKAQYIRIQALTLRQTGDESLIRAALSLLEESFRDYPDASDLAFALECAGSCCEALGRVDDAIAYYQSAMRREEAFPVMKSNSLFAFARLVVEQERFDLYDEAARAIESFKLVLFHWHVYMISGIKAVVAAWRGDRDEARSLARTAMQAAGVRDSGLGWGRGSRGIVHDTQSRLHRRLDELVV